MENEVKPGDEGYSDLYTLWVERGRPGQIEKLSEGWLRKALFPNGGTQPTFVMVSSHNDYGSKMATVEESWMGRSSLPKVL